MGASPRAISAGVAVTLNFLALVCLGKLCSDQGRHLDALREEIAALRHETTRETPTVVPHLSVAERAARGKAARSEVPRASP